MTHWLDIIDTQENGTYATILGLHKSPLEQLRTVVLKSTFLEAAPLSLSDILHNSEEQLLFHHCLVHDIVQIIVEFSEESKLKEHLATTRKKQPVSHHCIEVHKTKIYPLPALKIDQSTIKENAEVDKAVLKLDSVENFWEIIRLIAGDQLSLACLRALQNI